MILRDLKYSDMCIVKSELMLNLDVFYEDPHEQDLNQVYVAAGFLKPGKQSYAVAIPESNG